MKKACIALVLVVMIVTACGRHNGHSPADDQASGANLADHPEKEASLHFSDKLELFVEYDPLMVGEVSSFAIHLTDLTNTYSPVEDAEVNFTLVIDREVTQKFTASMDKPGIYIVDVSPQFSGEGVVNIEVSTSGFSQVFELDHIHIFKTENDVHMHDHTMATGAVIFTKEQAWSSNFNVSPVRLQEFSKVINTSGEILAMPGEKQNLTAKNDGIVLFATRNMVQGSPVNKGELIFTVSGKGFTNNNISVEFQNARLQFEKSKNQYLRHQKLVAEKIVSQSQFIESKNQYMVDSVTYYNLKEYVSDGGLKVFAPLTGYIHELTVSKGQFVSTGSVLATISSNKVLLLRADVPQQFYKILEQISDATFRPAYSDKVYSIAELNGKLLAKASSVAENNHYMPVYFEVNNDGTLLEGAFAEFHLKTAKQPGMIVIPIEALIEEQDNFYVYVQQGGESYLKKQVITGDSDGILVEIASGLKVGERVVTKGAVLLKASSASSAPVHSHTH